MKLHEFVVRRVILLVPVMIGVSLLTFALMSLVPGDAAASACGDKCGVVVGYGMIEVENQTTGEMEWQEIPISAYKSNVMRMDLDENLIERYLEYVGVDFVPYMGN